ncbi:MAG: AbrB-like transcriptional regulator, partial [Aphanizomenon sp.]
GATYTKAMNLKPGDEFEIRLGYKHIHLIQLGESDKQLTQSDDDTDESDAEE